MKILGAVLVGGICMLCYWIGRERGEARVLRRMEHGWQQWSATTPVGHGRKRV